MEDISVKNLKKGDRVWMGFVTHDYGKANYFVTQYEVMDPSMQVVAYVHWNDKPSEHLTVMPHVLPTKKAALERCLNVLNAQMQDLQTVIDEIKENKEFEG